MYLLLPIFELKCSTHECSPSTWYSKYGPWTSITWKFIGDAVSGSTPNPPHRNLHFNKIPRSDLYAQQTLRSTDFPHTQHEIIYKEYLLNGCNIAVHSSISNFAQSNLSIRKQLFYQRSLKSSSRCLSETGKKTGLEYRTQIRENKSLPRNRLMKNWYLTLKALQ